MIDGCVSDRTNVDSGTPQGSVLGPLLFLIYVNDLPYVVYCNVKLFAHDTKSYSCIRSAGDSALLQRDLQALVKWCETWEIPFNQNKCTILHIGKQNFGFTFTMGAYH